MPYQYGNAANPRAHYEGTGAEIAAVLDRVDVLVAGLGTGGTLMGTGARLRESFPDVVVAVAHRVGRLDIGGLALGCAVASAHRASAFLACAALVDRVKETVPIWKEQGFDDGGTEWVQAIG